MSQQGARAGSHSSGHKNPASTSLAPRSWQKPVAAAPAGNFLESDFPRLSDTVQRMANSNSDASSRSRSQISDGKRHAGSSTAQIPCQVPVAAETGIDFRIGSFAQILPQWREAFSAVVNFLHGRSDDPFWRKYVKGEGFASRMVRELGVSASSPDQAVVDGMSTALQGGAQDAREWLRSLVYKKDLHLPGIPVHVCLPTGFTKGQQNGDGNNCFIGSCVQSLTRTRVSMYDPTHILRCRQI